MSSIKEWLKILHKEWEGKSFEWHLHDCSLFDYYRVDFITIKDDDFKLISEYIIHGKYTDFCLHAIQKIGPRSIILDPCANTDDCIVNKILTTCPKSNYLGLCLDTLDKIEYRDESIIDIIKKYIDLEFTDTVFSAIKILSNINTRKSIEYLQQLSLNHLFEFNKKDQKKVIEILRKSGYTDEIVLPESTGGWYKFTTLSIPSGKIWAGDPQLANADDGCVVNVEPGTYVVECDGVPHRCGAVTKLRVRLESEAKPKKGKKLGETGTDSCTIGVCEIDAFEEAYKDPKSLSLIVAATEAQTGGFGIITVPELPLCVLPFVPMGSDGSGPVYALMSGKRVVGIQLPFSGEE